VRSYKREHINTGKTMNAKHVEAMIEQLQRVSYPAIYQDDYEALAKHVLSLVLEARIDEQREFGDDNGKPSWVRIKELELQLANITHPKRTDNED
jgi:hypothetical protein